MSQSIVLILVVCLFFHVRAQYGAEPHSGVHHPYKLSNSLVIGVFLGMVFLTIVHLAYLKFCRANLVDDTIHHQNFHDPSQSGPKFSGVDKTIIESIPFYHFSALKRSKEGLECAVCISKFEDSDVLRLLPKCKHAFHMNCIDQWLERHSTCPLCRYKFDSGDLNCFSHSNNSLRLSQNPSNLTEDPNLELFVEREQDDQNRWSDVSPSDLLSLNSEMLSVISSKRFSSLESNSRRFPIGSSTSKQIEKLKGDLERKRILESKFSIIDRNDSSSSFPSTSYNESNSSKMNRKEKRSVSEITIFSRLRQFSIKKQIPMVSNSGKEERIRRLWLPIVSKTVQWFSGQERQLWGLEKKCEHRDHSACRFRGFLGILYLET
ncbi:hypothetical protein CRYUN_Cryun03dG0038200 [Craigia yunnanensis]